MICAILHQNIITASSSSALPLFFVYSDLHRLLVPCHLLLVALNLVVQLHHSALVTFYLFRDVLVALRLGHHVLLDALLVVYVTFSDFLQLLLLRCNFIGDCLVVTLLVRNFSYVEALAFLLQLCEVSLQAF